MRQFIFLVGFLGLISCKKTSVDSDLEGYGAKATQFVGEDFILFAKPPSESDLEEFIQASNPRVDATKTANDIKTVANCFAIDERILTSQMLQESSFNPKAESPTHAVGLLQLTSFGIQEAEDQLGARGTRHAGSGAIAYFNEIRSTCLKKAFGQDFFKQMLLWKRASTGNRQKDLATKKSIIKSEPRVGLVYGVIMLKTLLSKAKSEDTLRNIEAIYKRSLWLYNGDPAEQEHYRSVILQTARGI